MLLYADQRVWLFWEPRPISFFFFSVFFYSIIYFLSKILNSNKWKVSLKSIDFTNLSNGLELEREGQTFTSRSHGLKVASIMMSNPYISKHWPLYFVFLIYDIMYGSTDINVFMHTSLIFPNISSKSIPFFSYSSLSIFKLHLEVNGASASFPGWLLSFYY